jgi:hypothetical protein
MDLKYYTTPDGKSIPFSSERIQLTGEDECSPGTYYELEINQFPKNTQINIVSYWGDDAMGDGEPPDFNCCRKIWRKIPNKEFNENRVAIIAEVEKYIFDPLYHP